jgi:20S proteasome alpha/beta subunit
MATSDWIAGIAKRAATLLASGKIDAATATCIGAATQLALTTLEEGESVDDKSVAELRIAERTLTQADQA